jgi:antirestriction protein ArdC
MTKEEKLKAFKDEVNYISAWVLTQMKAGAKNWQMPWHKGMPQALNPITGKFYAGNNQLILWAKAARMKYPTNHWATLRQWNKTKASVRRGEKGTLVCAVIPRDKHQQKLFGTSQIDPISTNQDGLNLENVNFKFYHVFNEAQVNGYFANQPTLFGFELEENDKVKELIQKSNAIIKHGGDRAFYSITFDYIQMPELQWFLNIDGLTKQQNYDCTLLHELIHWTGHVSRCDRFKAHGNERRYAFEELVAELGAAILLSHFHQLAQPTLGHAKYLNSWLNVLENDFSYFIEAQELARYAIFWLFRHTDVYPYDSKITEFAERKLDDQRLANFEEVGQIKNDD